MVDPTTFMLALLAALFTALAGMHTVKQGHMGVYYRGGRLLPEITEPGFHWKIPGLTQHENVQVTWQTDRLPEIVCGSSKGGSATLEIEVVNQLRNSAQCVGRVISRFGTDYDRPLIFDYIPSEVAQFCKNYPLEDIYIRRFDELDEVLMSKLKGVITEFGMSECLSIQKVRIGRPKLSTAMRTRFEAIEHEEKEKDLAEQKKMTEKVKLEAQLQRAKMLSMQEQEESRIQMETKVLAAKKQAEIQEIQNAMRLKQAQAIADSHLLQKQREADGLRATIEAFNGTAAMLEWHRNQAYWQSPNKVYYFADSAAHMPKTFVGGGALHGGNAPLEVEQQPTEEAAGAAAAAAGASVA